jgi:hypothetical protein
MEHQSGDLGSVPPGQAPGPHAAEAAQVDTADDLALDAAGEPDAGIPDDLGHEPDEQRPATGEPRVDAALGRLDDLAGLPVTEHRAVFEDVHRQLREVLGELDSGQLGAGDAAGAESRPGR